MSILAVAENRIRDGDAHDQHEDRRYTDKHTHRIEHQQEQEHQEEQKRPDSFDVVQDGAVELEENCAAKEENGERLQVSTTYYARCGICSAPACYWSEAIRCPGGCGSVFHRHCFLPGRGSVARSVA